MSMLKTFQKLNDKQNDFLDKTARKMWNAKSDEEREKAKQDLQKFLDCLYMAMAIEDDEYKFLHRWFFS